MPQLSTDEIAHRLPVWAALSELFLDTELSDVTLYFIARTVRESGLSIAQIEAILWHEVFPVYASNLQQVAGEWAGFPRVEIERKIVAHLRDPAQSKPVLGGIITNAQVREIIEADWARVVNRLARSA